MTQINVAGQKYTDGINGNIDYPLYDNLKKHILENEYLIGKVWVEIEQLKKDVAYIKNRLSPAEKAVGNGNETPPAWGFLTKKYT